MKVKDFLKNLKEKIDELKKYHLRGTILFQILNFIQDELGFIPDYALNFLEKELLISKNSILQTATFYHFFHLKPQGKNIIYLCTNISCLLNGAYETLEKLKNVLGIEIGETTSDNTFSIYETECIGQCEKPPAALINFQVVNNFTEKNVEKIISQLKKGK